MVVNMSEEQAARLRQEVPDILVLRDSPIELFRPVRATAGMKQEVSSKDLWHLKSIGLQGARKGKFIGNGNGVTVAVLDTGIDSDHPELADRLVGTYEVNPTPPGGVNQTKHQDTDGHGTHVAGLLCGKKVGVAPGVKLLSVIMLRGGVGYLSDLVNALNWAASRREVQIINFSAGIPGYLDGMRDICADLLEVGVLLVAAVGNEGRDATRSPGNFREVLSVGAVTREHEVWASSSSGIITADHHEWAVPNLVAPGHAVYSCVMGGGYEAWSGTSMAAPLVSGTAALILERYPTISVLEMKEKLLATCLPLGVNPVRQGNGLLQVSAAVSEGGRSLQIPSS